MEKSHKNVGPVVAMIFVTVIGMTECQKSKENEVVVGGIIAVESGGASGVGIVAGEVVATSSGGIFDIIKGCVIVGGGVNATQELEAALASRATVQRRGGSGTTPVN
ncbi:hypothetical protein PIB30_079231 [Stylosanthes scabra]|uniref:Uncharacterized protein n=1 Tax=Stylosanthes scabra TaxID=79078 RepID=A0ABU6TQN8_9FABA|nr:hypothetical protein [Stylosanthes scabra]